MLFVQSVRKFKISTTIELEFNKIESKTETLVEYILRICTKSNK